MSIIFTFPGISQSNHIYLVLQRQGAFHLKSTQCFFPPLKFSLQRIYFESLEEKKEGERDQPLSLSSVYKTAEFSCVEINMLL